MKEGFIRLYIKNSIYVDANKINGSFSTNQQKYTRDISAMIERMTYEDTTEKDNMVNFLFKSENAFDMTADPDMVIGTIVSYQFGLLGESVSEVFEGRITGVMPTYGERVSVEIQCLDNGTNMKKDSVNTIWKNKTTTQVVQAICDKYSLNYKVEQTTQVYTSLPQANKTDWEFLKELADLEAFHFFMRGNKLYFKHKDLTKPAIRTFTYGVDIIHFKPRFKEDEQDGANTKVNGVSFNAMTGQPITTTVDANSEVNPAALGKLLYDPQGVNTGQIKAVIAKTIVQPPQTDSNDTTAANAAQSARKKGKKGHEGDLKAIGDPNIKADQIITVGGVAQRHAGNWYISKVTHVIENGGEYLMTLSVDKDGGKEGTIAAVAVNTSVGPNTSAATKQLVSTVNGTPAATNTYTQGNSKFVTQTGR